jgi:hypothetical protein
MGILYFNRTDILINAARHTVKNGTQGKTDGRTQATLDAASDSTKPGAPRLFFPSLGPVFYRMSGFSVI